MPSRRELLDATTVAAVTTLAGCTSVFADDGSHAIDSAVSPIRPDVVATVVASDSTDWRPEDADIYATGLLFERDDEPGFVLVTWFRIELGDDWTHSAFQTSHEWNWSEFPIRSEVDTFDSNTRRTDDDPQFTLAVEQESTSVEWDVSNVSLGSGAREYEFASSVEDASPDLEDRVATVSFFVEFEEDRRFGSEHQSGSTLQLDYGDGAAAEWEVEHGAE